MAQKVPPDRLINPQKVASVPHIGGKFDESVLEGYPYFSVVYDETHKHFQVAAEIFPARILV